MKAPALLLVLLFACPPAALLAADEGNTQASPKPDAPKDGSADTNKGKAEKSAPASTAPDNSAKDPKKAGPDSDSAAKDSAPDKSAAAKDAKSPAGPPTVMPQVEVRRNRLVEIDREIMDLEDEIAREKKKTKSTETDKALNDSRVSSAAAVFGGSSAESRESLAAQRVSLMEAELSLLELSAASKSKAEKDDYQKQAAELRAMRRDLDRGAK